MQTRFGKTDARYWKQRVVKGPGRNFYGVQLQHAGERHYVSFGTANKDEAASRAVKAFLQVKAMGWRPFLKEIKPEPEKKVATVGEYLKLAEQVAQIEARTFNEYKKCFRRVVSDVMEIDGTGRYDWRTGRNQVRQRRVDAVRLDRLSPQKIHSWLKRALSDAGDDPACNCRFTLVRQMSSKSINNNRPTPERTSISAAQKPTPPTPITPTLAP